MNQTMHKLNTSILLTLIFLVFSCTSVLETAPEPISEPLGIQNAKAMDPDPLRYSDAINAFKQTDSLTPSPAGALLFVGSSSIRGWTTLAEDLNDFDVINRGFGGSHFSDLNYSINDLVFAHRPSAIFVYEGDNDIAWGKTPERVYKDYLTFLSLVREKWMDMPIYFISIKPSLERIAIIDEMAQANTLIRTHTEKDDRLYYVDVFSTMLDDTGKPKEAIFGHDGLHMNAQGYALWTNAVKEVLDQAKQ
ncbi:MAG: hypothetical protein K9N35_05515 [Candidatus Marinimicrobia bacterium]|nr:hypothetical protein [Candidatus Neomarinimicrobiota bacterium]